MKQVSEVAIKARIRRLLAYDKMKLVQSRTIGEKQAYGDFYTVNSNNAIDQTHIDLEQFSREIGVLRDGENMASH